MSGNLPRLSRGSCDREAMTRGALMANFLRWGLYHVHIRPGVVGVQFDDVEAGADVVRRPVVVNEHVVVACPAPAGHDHVRVGHLERTLQRRTETGSVLEKELLHGGFSIRKAACLSSRSHHLRSRRLRHLVSGQAGAPVFEVHDEHLVLGVVHNVRAELDA